MPARIKRTLDDQHISALLDFEQLSGAARYGADPRRKKRQPVDHRLRAAARHLHRTGNPQPAFHHSATQQTGHAGIKTVLNDIMGLTKINYNSCNFNDGLPVTVRFAKMVGEVLTMGSAKGTERQPFKYYV